MKTLRLAVIATTIAGTALGRGLAGGGSLVQV